MEFQASQKKKVFFSIYKAYLKSLCKFDIQTSSDVKLASPPYEQFITNDW